jgi:hypothetical protein
MAMVLFANVQRFVLVAGDADSQALWSRLKVSKPELQLLLRRRIIRLLISVRNFTANTKDGPEFH